MSVSMTEGSRKKLRTIGEGWPSRGVQWWLKWSDGADRLLWSLNNWLVNKVKFILFNYFLLSPFQVWNFVAGGVSESLFTCVSCIRPSRLLWFVADILEVVPPGFLQWALFVSVEASAHSGWIAKKRLRVATVGAALGRRSARIWRSPRERAHLSSTVGHLRKPR